MNSAEKLRRDRQIAETVRKVVRDFGGSDESVRQLGESIEEISDQVKLSALDAAIESIKSARTGRFYVRRKHSTNRK